jgi:hypothetical protein
MVKTYKINSFEELIKVGTTMGKNWFRGHSRTYNQLTPGIFREEHNTPMHTIFKPYLEQDIVNQFRRYAPSIISSVPEPDDYLTWLFWIQHYGLPTRLLDWSESILVAAFFSVIDHPEEDGELWSLHPDFLNILSGFYGLAFTSNSKVKYMVHEPFSDNTTILLEELGLEIAPEYPIAFIPPQIFPRMNAQHSVFTIHPKPTKAEFFIENAIEDEKLLARYIIPKELKLKFEENLTYLGINHRTLFPDLEGLAKSFKRDSRYFGWGQPNPPNLENFE